MARGIKSKYIKTITHREEKLFKQLTNTNICTIGQAKEFCGLNKNRLEQLQNSGYVSLNNVLVGGQGTSTMQLNTKGKAYAKNNLEATNFYRGNLNEAAHNLKLTDCYYKMLNKDPLMKWQNESELRELYPNKLINNKDCVDSVVTLSNGNKFALEVVGKKYTKDRINNKIAVGNGIAGKTILV